MAAKRTAEEIQRLLEGYRKRTVTRTEYCQQQGISTSMLDYYRRREALRVRPRMARVKLAAPSPGSTSTFTLVLRTGRRIESPWSFRDTDLARLIRIAEGE
jgi:hypothetical protein